MNLEGLTFDDVLLRPQKGVLESRSHADISVPSLNLYLPFISAPMPSVASRELIRNLSNMGGRGVIHRMHRSEDDLINEFEAGTNIGDVNPWVAIGLDHNVEYMIERQPQMRYFVLDIAHAHSEAAMERVNNLKSRLKDKIFLIAGNVATWKGAAALESAGADAIKVGIGPGSVCTTRQVTGFGVPQLEAIDAVASVGIQIPIIADGGIRNSGDIVKALAAGADAVMIGSLFARSIEAGTTSHYGCASKQVNGHHAPEGIEQKIEGDRESLEAIVKRLAWGIRSGVSYGGATSLTELRENAEWIRLTDAGRRESKLA